MGAPGIDIVTVSQQDLVANMSLNQVVQLALMICQPGLFDDAGSSVLDLFHQVIDELLATA